MTIAERMQAIAAEHGPWHTANIELAPGVWTISDAQQFETSRFRRYLQVVTDAAGKDLAGATVIDLASEEGLFGLELARRGAQVLGVEGRPDNVARALFAKETLQLDNYNAVVDDVRNVTPEKYGEFDIVLNLGILYHLDVPDCFEFLRNASLMARRFMFLSTNYARIPIASHEFRGQSYSGNFVSEHLPGTTPAERMRDMRASLDNPRSFWMTLPSIFNALADFGFTSALEMKMPREHSGEQLGNLTSVLAYKGERFELPSGPNAPSPEPARWPERERRKPHPTQTLAGRVRESIRRRGWTERIRELRRLARRRR